MPGEHTPREPQDPRKLTRAELAGLLDSHGWAPSENSLIGKPVRSDVSPDTVRTEMLTRREIPSEVQRLRNLEDIAEYPEKLPDGTWQRFWRIAPIEGLWTAIEDVSIPVAEEGLLEQLRREQTPPDLRPDK